MKISSKFTIFSPHIRDIALYDCGNRALQLRRHSYSIRGKAMNSRSTSILAASTLLAGVLALSANAIGGKAAAPAARPAPAPCLPPLRRRRPTHRTIRRTAIPTITISEILLPTTTAMAMAMAMGMVVPVARQARRRIRQTTIRTRRIPLRPTLLPRHPIPADPGATPPQPSPQRLRSTLKWPPPRRN